MECVYAALLLHSAKKPIDEKSVKKILEAAGINADDSRIKALVASLDGVNIDEAIKQPVAVATPAAPAGKPEEKKEEKDEKKTEEEAAGGLASLFG